MGQVRVDEPIAWLLAGDPAIRWQVMQDLLDSPAEAVVKTRREVASKGWGADLLTRQDPNGTWAGGLYTPKWTSTTYTLLLLWRCGLPRDTKEALRGVSKLWDGARYFDGGLTAAKVIDGPEACITSMYVSLATYFGLDDRRVDGAVEWLLANQLPDGGWNCQTVFSGDTHSSFHTSISALEALAEVLRHTPERSDVREAMFGGREFFLDHRLFKSHMTGAVVNGVLTRLSFPPRWHYDILRGLDHFAVTSAPRDDRYRDAIDLLVTRRRADGRWPLQNRHPGHVWFEMETPGGPSRWNTLRALRVLRWAER